MLRMVTLAGLLLSVALISGCDYGTKLEFNGGELYYTDNVDEAMAKRLGKYLVKEKFFDGKEKSVQLDKQDGVLQFRMVVVEDYKDRKDFMPILFRVMATQISRDVFDGQPLEVHLCDNRLKTLDVVKQLDVKKSEPVAKSAAKNLP